MPRLLTTVFLFPLFVLASSFEDTSIKLMSAAETNSRFLTQSTFGPNRAGIEDITKWGMSDWFLKQVASPATFLTPLLEDYTEVEEHSAGMAFWRKAITADDQLRQRMAFALSQIFVISDFNENQLFDHPAALLSYQDLLIKHAFGNYRDLLDAVTYSPAMGYYLTYMGSEKGDKQTGRLPDENYAREILQLFSIGLVQLNRDASPVLGDDGQPIETYSNQDITGLAKVFTGLNLNESYFYDAEGELILDEADFENEAVFEEFEQEKEEEFEALAYTMPMETFDDSHSNLEKQFLGLTIAANTNTQESIRLALDEIFAHPNVPPFISRQLIQRFVTSNPSARYIESVATSFATGSFRLPNGVEVGSYKRGDLAATLAAILFDKEARQGHPPKSFGKVREPVLRFTAWARAFEVENVRPIFIFDLWDTSSSTSLGQHPYRSPTVFNFYQPHHIAYGTKTGMANLNMPELQLLNASTIPSYINFMSFFINREMRDRNYIEDYQEFVEEDDLELDANLVKTSFYAAYTLESQLAHQPQALVDHLDQLMTYGRLSDQSKSRITQAIQSIPLRDKQRRIEIAILMVMTSPEFLVQR